MNAELEVVRHARARRAKLSIDPATGRARLTLPLRAALAPAMRWAQTQAAWIAAQQARLPGPRPFVDGAVVPVDGAALILRSRPDLRRRVVREEGELLCGGPAESMARRVEAWLRREALRVLSEETAAFAARAGVKVTQVGVGDTRSRWGSCASSGAIRYSWRLILAPPEVRRATVAHEVAHRVHMNHGREFHALVVTILGADPAPSREWLRHHGAGLHWFGRGS